MRTDDANYLEDTEFTGPNRALKRRAATHNKDRVNTTMELSEFIESERARIYDAATPERQEQFRDAERRSDIIRAWNQVCAGTREGKHVTGLFYVPERDELVVYTDGASWTQEISMMREIIRARMERVGGPRAHVGSIMVKTTKK